MSRPSSASRSRFLAMTCLVSAWIGFDSLSALEIVPQLPHSGEVNSLVVSPDGLLVLTAGEDGTLKLWDARAMMLLRDLSGHAAPVRAAAFLLGGKRAVSADEEGRLIAWDVATGEALAKSAEERGEPPDFILPSEDGESFFVDAAGGRIARFALDDLDAPLEEWAAHRPTERWRASATSAALLDRGRSLVSGGMDGEVRVLDRSSGGSRVVFSAAEGFVIESVAVAPGQDRIAVLSTDQYSRRLGEQTVRLALLAVPGWRSLVDLDIPTSAGAQGPQFSRDGRYLVVDGSPTLVLNGSTGEVLKRLVDANGVVVGGGSARVSPVLDAFYSITHDQIELRGLPDASLLVTTKVLPGAWPTSLSPDGKTLLFLHGRAGMDSYATLFDIDLAAARTFGLPQEADWFLESGAFSPDSASLSLFWNRYDGPREYGVNRLVERSGRRRGADFKNEGHAFMPFEPTGLNDSGYAWSPDGEWILKAGFEDGRVLVHNVEDAGRDFCFSAHRAPGLSFAISPDSKRVVSLDRKGVWRYWILATGEELRLPGSIAEIALNLAYGAPEFGFMPGEGYRLFIKDYGLEIHDLGGEGETEYHDLPGFHQAVALSRDGASFLAASGAEIHYLPAGEGAEPRIFSGHRGRIRFLAFSHDGSRFWSSSDDGTSRYWDIETGGYVAFVCRGSQWLVYTDDGYWDGSPDCGRFVAMVEGTRAYGIDQFAVRNNRPDLVLERLGSGDTLLVAHFRSQYLRRLRRLGIDEASLTPDPESLPSAAILGTRRSGRSLELDLRFEAGSGTLASWNVWVNDVPLFAGGGSPASGGRAELRQVVALNPGDNKVEVGCMNDRGLESFRAMSRVAWEGEAPGDLYFLGFGVSDYADPRLALNWAAKDALDLAELFSALEGEGYSKVVARAWTDAEVTRGAIAEAGRLLSEARPEDSLVLFISGHGVHDSDPEATYYYLVRDTRIPDLPGTAARFEELEALLQGTAPRTKLFLMDTCESGESEGTSPAPPASAAQGTGGKGARSRRAELGGAAFAGAGLREALARKDRWIYNDLVRRSGAVVLSSCRGDESSWEFDDLQNGAFTAALRTCLAPGLPDSADLDGDGRVDSQELRERVAALVSRIVVERTGEELQHPTVDRDNLSQTIAIRLGAPRWR